MSDEDSHSGGAAATGILQCLRMLAEEAGCLHLTRTLAALREAIEVCAAERDNPAMDVDDFVATCSRVLH